MAGHWEKRMVWVITVELKEEDEEGEPINWGNGPFDNFYAYTLEEAEQIRDSLLKGEDEFYGDLVDDCWISNEKEEREFWTKGARRKEENNDETESFIRPGRPGICRRTFAGSQ